MMTIQIPPSTAQIPTIVGGQQHTLAAKFLQQWEEWLGCRYGVRRGSTSVKEGIGPDAGATRIRSRASSDLCLHP